jgi:transcriptional regulator
MTLTFKEALEALVNARIEAGDDPMEVFDELHREANAVFGHYNLEFELALIEKAQQGG